MKKKYSRGEVYGLLLDSFIELLDVPIAMTLFPRSEIYRISNINDYYNRRRINRALNVFLLNNYIQIEGWGKDTRIKFTKGGRNKIKREAKMRNMELRNDGKWDGKWRLVIFDIPETKKKTRDAIAYKLKDLGFKPIQKSSFIYPYECESEVDFLKDYFNLNEEVSYMLVERLSNDKKIRKIFSL